MGRKRRQSTTTCSSSSEDDNNKEKHHEHQVVQKKSKITQDKTPNNKNRKTFLQVQRTWWEPSSSSSSTSTKAGGEKKMIVSEMEISESSFDDDDDSLFRALGEFSKSQGNLRTVDARIVAQIRQHLVDFATRPSVKKEEEDDTTASVRSRKRRRRRNTIKKSVWSHYAHHIYIQHQKVVQALGECDLDSNEDNEIDDYDDEDLCVSHKDDGDEDEEAQEEAKAKQAYRTYMLNPKTPGSLLELAFASMRYDLNAIVVQQHTNSGKKNKIFNIYNINPHYTNRIYLMNVGEPERGKWRHLVPVTQNPVGGCHEINLQKLNQPTTSSSNPHSPPHLQVGSYTIVKGDGDGEDEDNMFLQIEQSVKVKHCDSPDPCDAFVSPAATAARPCNLALFNRLLLGVATMDEFTVCMENPESQPNYKIPPPSCCSSIQRQTPLPSLHHLPPSSSPQYELEQLFKARISPTDSVCPFQSMEDMNVAAAKATTNSSILKAYNNNNDNMDHSSTQQPLYNLLLLNNNITNKLHNLGQNVNDQKITSSSEDQLWSQISRDFDCQNQNSRRSNSNSTTTSNLDLDTFLLNNFNFAVVNKNNPMVQTAVVVGTEFGSPQLLIRLEIGAKLTYEPSTTMYMMILNEKCGICIQFYDFTRNQWQPSQSRHGNFTIEPNTCFRFHNTAKDVVHIRCSWFSSCDSSSSTNSRRGNLFE